MQARHGSPPRARLALAIKTGLRNHPDERLQPPEKAYRVSFVALL